MNKLTASADSFLIKIEDSIILDTLNDYDTKRKEAEEETVRIRAGFPYNVVATMNNPEKTEEYLAGLQIKVRNCEIEKVALYRLPIGKMRKPEKVVKAAPEKEITLAIDDEMSDFTPAWPKVLISGLPK